MKTEQIVVVAVVAIILIGGAYVFWPKTPEPEPEPSPEPSPEPEPEPSPDESKYGGTVIYAQDGSVVNLDPYYTKRITSTGQHIFEPLVVYLRNGTLVPLLAEDWETSEDELTYTFHIREGVKFHCGDELTAEDVAFQFEYLGGMIQPLGVKTKLTKNFGFDRIESVDIIDDYTVQVTLKSKFGAFLSSLADTYVVVVHKEHYLERLELFADEPCATGAYELTEWEKDAYITLTRFDDYWQGQPYLEEIRIEIIPDVSSRMLALEAGEVDIVNSPGPWEEIDRMVDMGYQWISSPVPLQVSRLVVNARSWPGNNTDFRRAMFMSIDYEEAVKAILGPYSNTVDLSWPEGHWVYSAENQELFDEMYPYDPVEAKRIIDELDAELPLDYHGTLYFVSWKGHEFLPLIEYIVNEWKALGIPVELRMTEAGQKYEVMGQTGPEDMDFIIYHFYIYEPLMIYRSFHSNSGRSVIDGLNYIGLNDTYVDNLIDAGVEEADAVERAKIYQEIETYMIEGYWHLPLVAADLDILVNPEVAHLEDGYGEKSGVFGRANWVAYNPIWNQAWWIEPVQ